MSHPKHSTLKIPFWVFISSNLTSEKMLYSEADLITSMDRIETVNFHQEVEVNGIKFWCYNAGHVLGAAMIMLEIAGVKVGVVVTPSGNLKILLRCYNRIESDEY